MNNSQLARVQDFESALKTCNPEQLVAIKDSDEPMLVVAGPGTGKTHILSLRIENILLNSAVQPQNILCLTYSEAGRIAMRTRLEKFKYSDAYLTHIFTFHGFCNKVIQENMEYFSLKELSLLTDLDGVKVMTELIGSFDTNHPLKKFSLEIKSQAGKLRSLFQLMKQENWTPELISQKIDEYLAELPFDEEYIYKRTSGENKKGDLKVAKLNQETDKMEELRAAALEFHQYQAIMKKYGKYDYQDMINWVIKAFEEHEILLAKYQEQYQYFLVDEFQDTNGAQSTILYQLIRYWDNPNVFVVGDDDQAIYRFQGANLKNIQDFVEKYSHSLKVVMLRENFRSTQQILDASKTLIDKNSERIIHNATLKGKFQLLEKTLEAKNPNLVKLEVPVIVNCYDSKTYEEAAVASKIEEMYKNGENLAEVAIIYRNHKHIQNITTIFERRKIPYNATKSANLFEIPLANQLLTILKYINEEVIMPGSANHLLFQLLHFPYFNIHPRDVATMALKVDSHNNRLAWRELMESKEQMFKLNLRNIGAISSLEANLNYWTKESYNMTLQVLFEKILTKGGVLEYVVNEPDKIWHLEVINTLFEFIKTETANNPKLTLKSFFDMIDLMEKNDLQIPVNKNIIAPGGVNLITAHSSKGLEFETVFLIACNDKNWEKQRSRNEGFKLPKTLTLSVAENKEEEERRLFYVAMTRAKKQLHISYYLLDEKGKDQGKSIFVAEVENNEKVFKSNSQPSENELIEFSVDVLSGLPEPDKAIIESNFVKDKLKNLKLSVTHVNKYLKCPLTYYYENVLQIPTARSPSMGFGNAIHYALDQLFKAMKASGKDTFPSKEEFYNYFKQGMKHSASHFTEAEFANRLEYGSVLLPEFYDFYIHKWHKIVITEYRPSNVFIDKIPLSGALDKLEFYGKDSVNVVDYKTGKSTNIKKKMQAPKPGADPETADFEAVYGGDYWRQIVFYKILLENDKSKNWNMTSGELDFIEKNSKNEFEKEKIVVNFEDYELVKAQIKLVYDGITGLNFQGCGKKDCKWCAFEKSNFREEIPQEEEND
jgi:DNA helicase-2/ATP-dependent DNA helicase PcrA